MAENVLSRGLRAQLRIERFTWWLQIQLTALWALLVLAVFLSFAIHKHHWGRFLPPSGAAMLLGILSGSALVALGMNDSFGFSPDAFMYGFLPPIVFAAGLSLRNKDFFRNFGAIVLLAIGGTLISTAVFSTSTYALYKHGYIKRSSFGPSPVNDCLMYGAMVSGTDAVATLSVFSDLRAPAQVYNLVFGESVLNDAVAILLFSTVQETYQDDFSFNKAGGMAARFLRISFGSLLVGIGLTLVFAFAFRKLQFAAVQGSPAYHSAVYEMSVMLLSAYLAYIAAESLELSGIVALFFAGVVHNHYSLYNISAEGATATKDMVEVASFCCETFVFVYLGLQVPIALTGASRDNLDMGLVLSGIPLCLVARALSVFPLTALANAFRRAVRRQPISLPHQTLIWGAGLRGAVTYALAKRLRSPEDGTASGNPALEISTLVIVVVSTLGLGAATGPLMHMLGIKPEPTEEPVSAPPPLTDHNSADGPLPPGALLEGVPFGPSLRSSSGRGLGIHTWWRGFDGVFLKPIFGGRPHLAEPHLPPPPVPAEERLASSTAPLLPLRTPVRSFPDLQSVLALPH